MKFFGKQIYLFSRSVSKVKGLKESIKSNLEHKAAAGAAESAESEEFEFNNEINKNGGRKDKLKENSKETKKKKEIDEEFIMAKMNLHIQTLPINALKRAHQIFSRYPSGDVINMGKEFTKAYFFSHCLEKPTSFENLKPFSNHIDLLFSETVNQKLIEQKIHLGSEKKLIEIEESKEKNLLLERPVSLLQLPKNPENNELPSKIKGNNPEVKGMNFSFEYNQNAAIGYVYKRLPKAYAVANRVLSELVKRFPDLKPKNFLDYNAKAGSASLAFHERFGNDVEMFALEENKIMKKIGKHITQDIDNSIWLSSLVQTINHPSAFNFDVIYCGYMLSELQTEIERINLVESLWHKVAQNGFLVIVEQGSSRGFRFVHDFRDWIREKENQKIIAPCPHSLKCPMNGTNEWCNFGQANHIYPKSVFPKLAKQLSDEVEKFSYIIIQKTSIIKEFEESKTPQEKAMYWERIVRPIIPKTKHYILDLCTTEGKLERRIIAKSHGKLGGFKEGKKLKWGDLWRFSKRIPNKYRKESKKGLRLW